MGFDSNENVNKIIASSNEFSSSLRSISVAMYSLLSMFNFRHKDVLQVLRTLKFHRTCQDLIIMLAYITLRNIL